eukprot:11216963-Heterocapsa_arctica.AAC.1
MPRARSAGGHRLRLPTQLASRGASPECWRPSRPKGHSAAPLNPPSRHGGSGGFAAPASSQNHCTVWRSRGSLASPSSAGS